MRVLLRLVVLPLLLMLPGCQYPAPPVPASTATAAVATATGAVATQAPATAAMATKTAPAASPSATATAGVVPSSTPRATTAPSAVATTPAATPAATQAAAPATLVFQTAAGSIVPVQAEIVNTAAGRARGLMFRERLADGEGMLFIFPADTTSGFWMENTLVALSIAWVSVDGVVLGLDDMQPLSRDVHQPTAAYRYALEVPQGYFTRQGIKVGDRLLAREGANIHPLAQLPAAREAR